MSARCLNPGRSPLWYNEQTHIRMEGYFKSLKKKIKKRGIKKIKLIPSSLKKQTILFLVGSSIPEYLLGFVKQELGSFFFRFQCK